MKDELIQKVVEIAERVGLREGIEIVEVELRGNAGTRLLRIFIDKPGGVTHGDCEAISLNVGTILDMEDVIPGGRYTLEVSSPGVERRLRSPKDFEQFAGRKIKVILRAPLENSTRWEGTLTGFADGILRLEPAGGTPLSIPLEQVDKAHLKFEW